MADVFLSYAREDRDRAKALTGALEAAGLSVWWDRDLVPGPSYDDAIERELNGASCVLVLWSSRSIRSDWVKDEAEAGKARGVLINVLLETGGVKIDHSAAAQRCRRAAENQTA